MNTALKLAAAATALPLLAWPSLIARNPGATLAWIYPSAIVVYGWAALRCGRERPVLAWILIIMSALTSLAIWMI